MMTVMVSSKKLLLFIVAVVVVVVHGQICQDEATALEGCAAEQTTSDVTQVIASCLTCVIDITKTSTTLSDCTTYANDYCQNLDDTCDSTCDDGKCGSQFRNFYECMASKEYEENAVASTTATTNGGDGDLAAAEKVSCAVSCKGGIDGTGDIGGLDDIADDEQKSNGNTDQEGDGDDPDDSSEGILSSTCKAKGANLITCLRQNGRDRDVIKSCLSCIAESFPTASDCEQVEMQFCSSIATCESSCAAIEDACLNDFSDTLSCVLNDAVSHAGCNNEQQRKCETYQTSSAAAVAAAAATSNVLFGIVATVLVVTTTMTIMMS